MPPHAAPNCGRDRRSPRLARRRCRQNPAPAAAPDRTLRAGDAVLLIDEQFIAPAPLRRADEQVAQGFDEGRAEHGDEWCGEEEGCPRAYRLQASPSSRVALGLGDRSPGGAQRNPGRCVI